MIQRSTAWNLLFAYQTLEQGWIELRPLLQLVAEWRTLPNCSIDQLFRERELLTEKRIQAIYQLVEVHLEDHKGDETESLADIASQPGLREALINLHDSEIESSIPPFFSSSANIDTEVDTNTAWDSRYQRPFQIHRHGGLGIVYRVQDKALEREVAYKEIKLQHAYDPEYQSLFEREALITARLAHPNIVPVHDFGIDPYERQLYYSMRFIHGDTLYEAIHRYHQRILDDSDPHPRPTLRDLLGWFLEVCNAIAYAHYHGVIHRDLKPQNVMLGVYGEPAVDRQPLRYSGAQVIDWGLAKRIRTEKVEETILPRNEYLHSQMGRQIGTRPYMAPEQWNGQLDDVDERSDIYNLGAILFEILTCQPPHTNDYFSDGPLHPRDVLATVPIPLDAITAKALSYERDERYQSVQELADEVRRWLAEEPLLDFLPIVEDSHRLKEEYPNNPINREQYARNLNDLGLIQLTLRRYEASERSLKQAIEEFKALVQYGEAELVTSQANVSPKLNQAIHHWRTEVADVRFRLALLYHRLGRTEEAKRCEEEARADLRLERETATLDHIELPADSSRTLQRSAYMAMHIPEERKTILPQPSEEDKLAMKATRPEISLGSEPMFSLLGEESFIEKTVTQTPEQVRQLLQKIQRETKPPDTPIVDNLFKDKPERSKSVMDKPEEPSVPISHPESETEQAILSQAEMEQKIEGTLVLDPQHQGNQFRELTTLGSQTHLSSTLLYPLLKLQIDRPLGQGGMGTVFRALDTNLNRLVALKTSARPNSKEFVADYHDRLLLEADFLARFQHPNVPTIYFLSYDQDNPFFVMEILPQQSLGHMIDDYYKQHGTFQFQLQPAKQLLVAILGTCEALHAAHQQRIIHRDPKPQNILITEEGIPKLIDWGLAKKLDEVGPSAWDIVTPAAAGTPVADQPPHLTRAGAVIGTPTYMAPEMARGDNLLIDHRADIYCMGATLFHVLTGKSPYEGSKVHEILEILVRHPKPPEIRHLHAELPEELNRICAKAMAGYPSERYQTIAEFSQDLKAWINSYSQPQSPTVEVTKPTANWMTWLQSFWKKK